MALSVASFTPISNWLTSQGNPSTRSLTGVAWSAGDIIVMMGGTESSTILLGVPTNANLTFSLVTSATGGTECNNYIWAATAGSSQSSQQIDVAQTGSSGTAGICAWVITGAPTGTTNGLANRTEGTISRTVSAGSVVCYAYFDFLAAAAGRTIATASGTPTERVDVAGGAYGVYVGDWVGVSAGTFGFGVTSYTSLQVSHGVIEILAPAATASASPVTFGPGNANDPRWQWTQQHGIDASTAITATGSATAAITVFSSAAGTKSAPGAAKAALAGDSKTSGTKAATGAASSSSAIGSKTAGVKGASGAAVSSSTVASKTAGVKAAIGTAKSHPAIVATQAGLKTAVAAAKSASTVFSTAAGSSATTAAGAAKAAIAIFAKVAGSKNTAGAATASTTAVAKVAGVKAATGTGKASVAAGTKQAGVKTALGTAKASIAGVTKTAGSRAATWAAKVAVAIYSRLAGTASGQETPGIGCLEVDAPNAALTIEAPTAVLAVTAPAAALTVEAPTAALTIESPTAELTVSEDC